jgi:replicative DNA helicase
VGLRQDDLEDCPRQIANAWKRTRLPVLGAAEEATPIADAVDELPTPTLLDAIEAWRQQETTPVLKTGIESLDKLCDGGLPLGQMTALAAAPGVGKSALALHLAIQCLLKNNGLVATWCLGEMTKAALAARAITNFGGRMHGVTLQDVIKKVPPSEEIAVAITPLAPRLKIVEAPLIIDRIERAVVKDKPQLLIVDYIQLVQSSRHFQDQTGEIVDCLRKLRQITTTHNIATIIVTNIAKGCDHNTEIGNIGKGSNQIDFDVDNFLFGHRIEETFADGGIKIEWKCKKLRQGQMADIELWFYGKYQTFEDVSEPVVEEVEAFKDFAPKPNRRDGDWSAF